MERNAQNRSFEMCRTCLNELPPDSESFRLDYLQPPDKILTIQQKLLHIVPGMNLDCTPNALICADCSFLIESFYEFKQICRRNEKYYIDVHTKAVVEAPIQIKTEPIEAPITQPTLNETMSISDEGMNLEIKSEPHLELVDINTVMFNTDVDNFIINEGNSYESSCEKAKRNASYQCRQCRYSTAFKSTLLSHVKKHMHKTGTGFKKRLSCSQCPYFTFYKSNFIGHKRNHALNEDKQMQGVNEDAGKIEICEHEVFNDATLLNEPVAQKGENPPNCNIYNYNTVNPVHKQTQEVNEDASKIEICDDTTHLSEPVTQKDENPPNCNTCNYNMVNSVNKQTQEVDEDACKIEIHQHKVLFDTTHSSKPVTQDEKPPNYNTYNHNTVIPVDIAIIDAIFIFKCDTCGVNYPSLSELSNHNTKMHLKDERNSGMLQAPSLKYEEITDVKEYRCTKCNFSTKIKYNLEVHTKHHASIHRCPTCNYTTIRKRAIVSHMRRHLRNRSFTFFEYEISKDIIPTKMRVC